MILSGNDDVEKYYINGLGNTDLLVLNGNYDGIKLQLSRNHLKIHTKRLHQNL